MKTIISKIINKMIKHKISLLSTGHIILLFLTLFFLTIRDNIIAQERQPLTDNTGIPLDGELKVFEGEPFFNLQFIDTGDHVRFPNITVALDGTVLAFWGQHEMKVGRSIDGGNNWEYVKDLPEISFFPKNVIVDENSGDILIVSLETGKDLIWRSSDRGKTWKKEKTVLKPNEVMKWVEQTGINTRVGWDGLGDRDDGYWMRTGHGESGITLKYGEKKGRIIMYAAFRPHSKKHPQQRDPVNASYSCAIYSDDGGSTWQVSSFFPKSYTEVAGLAELQDGRIYYNARSHDPTTNMRHIAWSYDSGETWQDLETSTVLPDGGGYGRGYGMMGGVLRLPVKDRDILLFSNADTGGGEREKMTVWASFDGGNTWPVKRLVYPGPAAYSSLAAGRPGTSSEGMIYLMFEGAETHRYHGMQVASFNLSWLLEGIMTGDGQIPGWLSHLLR